MIANNETNWQNPFEKSLLEDWRLEEFPQNYIEMVECFISPEFMNIIESPDVKPKIIMGGRGTGKSHILRMLSIESVASQIRIDKAQEEGKALEKIKIKLKDYKKPYFAIYLKAIDFYPLSTSNITYLSEDQLRTLFEHMLNMVVCSKIIEGAKVIIENFEDVPDEIEDKICLQLTKKFSFIINGKTSSAIEEYPTAQKDRFNVVKVPSFSLIEESLKAQIDAIRRVTKEFPWFKDFSRFKKDLSLTSSPECIIEFFDIIRKEFLKDKVLFIMIDEYDELDKYQQMFINYLIRTRRLTFKIASAIGGIITFEYKQDKELHEINDYDPIIPLHFETSGSKRYPYRILLKNIFIRRLSVYGNYKVKDPNHILKAPTLEGIGINENEYQEELKSIYEGLTRKKDIKDPDKYWKNFEGHYKEAAIYRLLRRKGKDKLFAGFDDYSNLSSGIVRQFILLCRDAFSLAHVRGIEIEKGTPIPFEIQSKAAEDIAKHLLENEYVRKLPKGRYLKQLVYDLGRILEYKIYRSTEPQINRFQIKDSLKLANSEYEFVREIIEEGFKMPHFLCEIAFRPKQPIHSVSSFTFSLNAIFSPILKIPPQKRWRFSIYPEELKGLCSLEHEQVIRKVIRRIGGEGKETTPSHTLFERSITLSNCPVTGKGCNQNLLQYFIVGNRRAFLAVPFKKDWVSDPRRWIKSIMTDEFKIPCVDVDDFPQVGFILCKICSCVRQMPIGLFEITELNPNVIFELGMATALNKINYMFVNPKQVPKESLEKYPPKPLTGIEYIPYKLSRNAIFNVIKDKMIPSIEEVSKHPEEKWCWLLRGQCPHKEIITQPNQIFVGLPYDENPDFFGEIEKLLKNMLNEFNVKFFNPAKTQNELCQQCEGVRESIFCIIDTTYNDVSMLFALGIAFGKDKKFIQLHNTSLSSERPISDLKSWAIEYKNTSELKEDLQSEIEKRLEEF